MQGSGVQIPPGPQENLGGQVDEVAGSNPAGSTKLKFKKMIQYTYLIASFPLILVWISLYMLRKDTREEMFFMSMLAGVLNPIMAWLLWNGDWWSPLTITATKVGIEDFILGFTAGGIAAVLYEEIFKKYFHTRRGRPHNLGFIIFSLSILAGIISLFYVFNLSSFWATFITLTLAGIILMVLRLDLFKDAITSAVLMVVACLPFYIVATVISPEWVTNTYAIGNLSGYKLYNIPVEEFIFFFQLGFIVGPAYEYWKNKRLISKR